MNNLIKTQLLLFVVGIGTIADYFMISMGLATIFKTGGLSGAFTCYIGGLICVILTASADTIWHHRKNPTYLLLIPLLSAAVVISAKASINYMGIYVLGGQSYDLDISKGITWLQGWKAANPFASVGMGVVIFYALISPIYLTYLIREQQKHARQSEAAEIEDDDSNDGEAKPERESL